MHRLIKRLERLEAKMIRRPAAPDFDDLVDLSKLSIDELRRLIVAGEICEAQGKIGLLPEQSSDVAELFDKAIRWDAPELVKWCREHGIKLQREGERPHSASSS